MNKIFALVDCNNFYASCERVFQPALQNRPIVVLSNNDGCIVARSNEAKTLGIPMAAPYHQYKKLLQQHKVAVFSSNYALYGDMSRRVMDSLFLFAPNIEVYSIDEAFLRLDGLEHQDLIEYSSTIKSKIGQWTGLPISIGIGPTKTLAKIANQLAKKHSFNGVYDLRDSSAQQDILTNLRVEEIWGISKRWGQRLRNIGIYTALQLRDSDPERIRKYMSVVAERMVLELRGTSCLDLEHVQPRKNIMTSQSFGTLLTEIEPIQEAIANYTARACEKLRAQKHRASAIMVSLRTNYFQQQGNQYSNAITYQFDIPTSDTSEIIKAAQKAIKSIYRPRYRYHKASILLMDLSPDTYEQQDLFVNTDHTQSDQLMSTIDKLNRKIGKNTVFYASQGIKRQWTMRSAHRSPCYTTKWADIVRVHA